MHKEDSKICTRFAPSPTGDLHVGGARTAIFSWLMAKHFGGKFLLRIEDTDKNREKENAIEKIIESLKWLGLDWDGPVIYQSQRLELYSKYLEQLVNNHQAYYCNCSLERLERLREIQVAEGKKPKYDGHCRSLNFYPAQGEDYVVRFKTPLSGQSVFQDLIRGEVSVDNSELDDLVIWRSVGGPTYNFCVVIDDWLSGVTHVVRGEDHINNTHRQKHIAAAFDASKFIYAHVPMILDENGQKLSKRRESSSLLIYKEMGILADAMINYLVKLGWGHKNQELFSRTELIELFDITKVKPSPAAINGKKLDWINKKYLHALMKDDDLVLALAPQLKTHWHKQNPQLALQLIYSEKFKKALNLYRNRVSSLDELKDSLISFFDPNFSEQEMLKNIDSNDKLKDAVQNLFDRLKNAQLWDKQTLRGSLENFLKEMNDDQVARTSLRYILLAKKSSPPIDEVFLVLDKEESLKRILQFLKN